MANSLMIYDGVEYKKLKGSASNDRVKWDSATSAWVTTAGPVVAAKTHYVAKNGDDTAGDGSLAQPFLTIGKALTAAGSADGTYVLINVLPGTYVEDVTISRHRTLLVGANSAPETLSTVIKGVVTVDPASATQKYNDVVGIANFLLNPDSAETDPSLFVTGTGLFSCIVNNCYITTENTGAYAVHCDASSASRVRLLIRNSIVTRQNNGATVDVIRCDRGDVRMESTQVYASVTGSGSGIYLNNNASLFADRLLVETNTSGPAVVVTGSLAGTKLTASNSSFAAMATSGGTAHALSCTNSAFPVPAALLWQCVLTAADATAKAINGTLGASVVYYGALAYGPNSSGVINSSIASGVTLAALREHLGDAYLLGQTASLPLKLDSNKKLVSAAIDLSSAEVTNVLAYSKGGTGQSTYAKGDIVYASATNTLAKLPIGTVGYVLTVSASGVPEWAASSGGGGGGGSGTVTSIELDLGSTGLTVNSVTAATITTAGTFTIGGVLNPAYGGLGIDASGVTAGELLIGTSGGGGFAVQTVSGDATLTASGAVTVTGVHNTPFSSTLPSTGQSWVFNGTQWEPGSQPQGGSGGGGVTYYFNKGTPVTGGNLPADTFQLGRTAEVGQSSIAITNIPTTSWTRIAGFVSAASDPGVAALAAGLWDFNLWIDSTAPANNQAYFRVSLYAYDGSTNPETGTVLAQTDNIYAYDHDVIAQYISSMLINAGVSWPSNTSRIYLLIEARATTTNRDMTFYFGNSTPSHTHTAIPAVTGTGFVKVVNDVVQPTAQKVDLASTDDVTGTLPVANGGTGAATLTQHAVLIGNGTSAIAEVVLGAGQIIVGTTSGAPAATTLTEGIGVTITSISGSITIAIGQDVATSASPTFAGLTVSGLSTAGYVKNNASGVLSTSETVPATDLSGIVPVSNGGTGWSSFATGAVLIGNGSSDLNAVSGTAVNDFLRWSGVGTGWVASDLAGYTNTGIQGTANQINALGVSGPLEDYAYGAVTLSLPQDIAQTSSPTFAGLTLTTALTVDNGGTGVATLTQHGILIGAGTGPITATTLTNGQLLIGSTGAAPVAAGLTGGTGVTVTTGAGSITVAIGQAVGTGDSPSFTGLTVSGLSDGLVRATSGVLAGGATVSLSTEVTGVLGVTRGGTGLSSIASGQILYASSANTLAAGSLSNLSWTSVTPTSSVLIRSGALTSATFSGGSSTSSTTAGAAIFTGGTNSSTGAGGTANVNGGNAISGNGGAAFLLGGLTQTGTGGAAYVRGGIATSSGTGGSVYVDGGYSLTTSGSAVFIGTQSSTPYRTNSVTIGRSGITTTMDGTVNVSSLTASQFVKTDASKNLVSQQFIDLAAEVTGVLPVTNGGTGVSTFPVAGYVNFDPAEGTYETAPTIPAADVTGIPYDVSGEAFGTPALNDEVWHFGSVRPWTLAASGHYANCLTAPTALCSLAVYKVTAAGDKTSIGAITFGVGNTGTFVGFSTTSFAVGDWMYIKVTNGPEGIVTPFWTFKATVA